MTLRNISYLLSIFVALLLTSCNNEIFIESDNLTDITDITLDGNGDRWSSAFSAHTELTMPIFSVNGGVGYNVVNPKGDRTFYQSLTLKTFIMKNFYINVGYSLGKFQDPRNLMLGIGFRL